MKELAEKIIQILQEDSRTSAKQIAVMLGESRETVESVIRNLEDEGIIVRYTTLINAEKLNRNGVEALIEIKVTPQKHRGFDAIAEEIYNFDEVKSVFLMSGGFDLAVFVWGNTLKEVAMFVSEKLSVLDTVVGTATHFILKKYKTEGIILETERRIERLAIQV